MSWPKLCLSLYVVLYQAGDSIEHTKTKKLCSLRLLIIMSFSLILHICVVILSVNLNKIPKKTSQAIPVVFSFSQWCPKYSIFFNGLFLYYALIKSPLHTYLQVVNFLSNLYLPLTQKTRNTTFIFISFIDFKKQSLCIVQEQFWNIGTN